MRQYNINSSHAAKTSSGTEAYTRIYAASILVHLLATVAGGPPTHYYCTTTRLEGAVPVLVQNLRWQHVVIIC